MIQSISCVLHLSKEQYNVARSFCLYSRNLYNLGLYETRQHFFETGKFLTYNSNYRLCKGNENYKLLQAACGQQALKLVESNMIGFFGLLRAFRSGKPDHRPGLPHYLEDGKLLTVTFPKNSFSIKGNTIRLGISREFRKHNPKTRELMTFKIPHFLKNKNVKEVELIPVHNGRYFKLSYTYEIEPQDLELNPKNYLSIDLGLNNFATYVDSSTGTASIIDGKYVKSINQWYNKENARLQSEKDKSKIKGQTKRQDRLLDRRNNRVTEFLNRSVNYLVSYCAANDIGSLVIGDLKGSKDEINLGRVNNQNFVSVPYYTFKQKLKNKCEFYGINYIETNEAYTSVTDSLALGSIGATPREGSKRVKRGLYQSQPKVGKGTLLNADVNGALNILRKVAGDSLVQKIVSSGLVNRPTRVKIAYEDPRKLN